MSVKKSFKKILCAVLAGTSVFASATMFSACTTSHPKVEMKISFNNITYTLEYKLYRKLAPATVQHFLELAENKYYDGLCVHDFTGTAGKMYTGGYTYDAAQTSEGGLVEKNYFDVVKDLKLTATVWHLDGSDSTNTVYGEFADNGFEVESGALKQSYGSLTMYYTPKGDSRYVTVQRSDGSGKDSKLYKYNSATSLFYISLTSGSTTNNAYCTFATLEDDSVDVLNDLKEAIETYIADEYEGENSDFAPSTRVTVDEDDPYVSAEKNYCDYSVPKNPIVIKSVKVKSY